MIDKGQVTSVASANNSYVKLDYEEREGPGTPSKRTRRESDGAGLDVHPPAVLLFPQIFVTQLKGVIWLHR